MNMFFSFGLQASHWRGRWHTSHEDTHPPQVHDGHLRSWHVPTDQRRLPAHRQQHPPRDSLGRSSPGSRWQILPSMRFRAARQWRGSGFQRCAHGVEPLAQVPVGINKHPTSLERRDPQDQGPSSPPPPSHRSSTRGLGGCRSFSRAMLSSSVCTRAGGRCTTGRAPHQGQAWNWWYRRRSAISCGQWERQPRPRIP